MSELEEKLITSIENIIIKKYNIDITQGLVMLELPKDKTHGQFTTNIAMRISKLLGKKPQDIASEIKDDILDVVPELEKIEIAGPGFINFFIKSDSFSNIINIILDEDINFGKNNVGAGKKVLLEYVSANPTGSLHLGHARGAVWGDTCARLMNASGFNCLREYYINDAGNQINNLAVSIDARYKELFGLPLDIPEGGYHAEDIIEIAKMIKDRDGDKWLNADDKEKLDYFREFGMQIELQNIKNDLKLYRCEFDSWISEKSLYEKGLVDKTVDTMKQKGLIYEEDGALWFQSTKYGDDKDRVLKKTDGSFTYFTPDIANHLHKIERGYETLIDLWGADHAGYIDRMKNALYALGYSKDTLTVDIIQMVRLIENGNEVKMSKRSGKSYTIRDLCDEVGVDTARYFFIDKALDSQMDFDLGLAKLKTNENPVFYIQYAYVRLNSIMNKVSEIKKLDKYNLLNDEQEITILRQLSLFPKVVAESAVKRAPNKLCNYIYSLAKLINSYYVSCSILNAETEALRQERLALIKATSIVLKNAFNLIGIEALEKM